MKRCIYCLYSDMHTLNKLKEGYFQTVFHNLESIKFTYLPGKKIKFQFRNYIRVTVNAFTDRSCDSTSMDTTINNRVLNVQKSFLG